MSIRDASLETAAERLRREFDQSFGRAEAGSTRAIQRFIAIRVGGDPYAVALSQVAEVHGERKVAKLPLPVPELLGVANLRGVVAPVYDLAVCLGYAAGGHHRATLLVRGPSLLALAFDAVEANLVVEEGALVTARSIDPARPHLSGLVRAGDAARPLVDLDSVLETIARRAKSSAPRDKEP